MSLTTSLSLNSLVQLLPKINEVFTRSQGADAGTHPLLLPWERQGAFRVYFLDPHSPSSLPDARLVPVTCQSPIFSQARRQHRGARWLPCQPGTAQHQHTSSQRRCL